MLLRLNIAKMWPCLQAVLREHVHAHKWCHENASALRAPFILAQSGPIFVQNTATASHAIIMIND